jgi:beta-glucosidase
MKKVFDLFAFVILLSGCHSSFENEFEKEIHFNPFQPPVPYEIALAKADSIIKLMTLEEKIEMIGGHNIYSSQRDMRNMGFLQ